MIFLKTKRVIQLCFMVTLATRFSLATADQIECTFDVNDSRKTLTLFPNKDVYTSTKIDLPGGFRFSGQYLSELKTFKAYIYHTPRERYVLLALQSFAIAQATCPQDFGQHRVYDSEDERELYFHCRKICAQ
jgi:hypothetical protein